MRDEQKQRYEQLYRIALSKLAEEYEFDATEWLDEAESEEFTELQNTIFSSH
jgi:hypothetical protein